MAAVARAVATLRVMGDDLEPTEVTSLLGVEPTVAHRKGEATSKSGAFAARTGNWRLEAKTTEPEDVNSQVAELLAKLPRDLRVWAELGSRFHIDLFCGWFLNGSNEGVEISAANLRALGERGIELQLDIYGPETYV